MFNLNEPVTFVLCAWLPGTRLLFFARSNAQERDTQLLTSWLTAAVEYVRLLCIIIASFLSVPRFSLYI